MPMTGKPREMAQGLPGKQPCPLACCSVPAYAMQTYVSLISVCAVCLGWGLPSRVSSLWFCFPCLPQQKPLTTACLDVVLSVQQKMSGPSTCFGSVFHCCCFDFFETRPHCIFLVVLELTL